MNTSPDFDSEILCLGKFIFKQSTTCSDSSRSENIFVCNGDELLYWFDCYVVPSAIPNWVNVEERFVENCYSSYDSDGVIDWVTTASTSIKPNYHCTVFWQHPELSGLWAEYLAQFDWLEPGQSNSPDPEIWLKGLLYRLEFDGLVNFEWQFIEHCSPSDEVF